MHDRESDRPATEFEQRRAREHAAMKSEQDMLQKASSMPSVGSVGGRAGELGQGRMPAQGWLLQEANRLRRKAESLEQLAMSLPSNFAQTNPAADEALWQLVCDSMRGR